MWFHVTRSNDRGWMKMHQLSLAGNWRIHLVSWRYIRIETLYTTLNRQKTSSQFSSSQREVGAFSFNPVIHSL